MTRTIVRERLPHHPMLGRHIHHDSRSRAFALPEADVDDLLEVRHTPYIGVLDQAQIGSCTGNAGVATIYRAPYLAGTGTVWYYPPTEEGAIHLYSDTTHIDPFPGAYPPQDTGSDGLSIAKILQQHQIISGYLWAFTITSALVELQARPLMTGIPFLNSMFDTDPSGHMKIMKGSGWAGGHELCVDEYRPPVGATPAMVGGPNSWGTTWGDQGRWLLTVEEWEWLLSLDGDVTALVPNDEPAPVPDADLADEDDVVLWDAVGVWAERNGVCSRSIRRALREWADAKDL